MTDPLFTTAQLIAHGLGDYVGQSHWQATEKVKKSSACAVHAVLYGAVFLLPFLDLRPSFPAIVVIIGTHFVIDRWQLARYVVYAKNFLSPRTTIEIRRDDYEEEREIVRHHWHKWEDCKVTGFHKDTPIWLSTWLLIIADNLCHVLINAVALRYL